MIVVGVDIGTTRIKAVAYDYVARDTLANASVGTPVKQNRQGAVHEPIAVFTALLHCIEQVVVACAARGRAADIAAICAVSLAEEVVLVGADGQPVYDAPVWYEPRGAHLVGDYVRRRGASATTNATLSLYTLRWIAEDVPQARGATTRFTDLASFALCRLAGRRDELVMDHSHASRTGAFDVTDKSFDPDALDWAGDWLPAAPQLVRSGTAIGQLSREFAEMLHLDGAVQIVSGAHDHFAAAFACGVRRPGEAMLSTGTAEAQFVLSDTVPSARGLPVDVGCFLDDGIFYAHRGLAAGKVFASWRTLLNAGAEPRDSWFEPPAGTRCATSSARCSIDAEHATASFRGLHDDVDVDSVLRCLSEGLAMWGRDSLAVLEQVAGAPIRRLTVAGPAAAQEAWRRLRAAVLQRDLRIVTTPEPAALGAAALAQRALTGTAGVPTTAVDVPAGETTAYYRALIDAYENHRAPSMTTRTA